MKHVTYLDDFVFALEGFLSPEECAHWIAETEATGFEPALVNTQHGPQRIDDIRNNDRVIRDDAALADMLWPRLRPHMPGVFRGRAIVGLNERFRFYRYDPEQKFDWHQDGYYERPNGERSLFTFMIYLNDGFEGGGTSFCNIYAGQNFDDFCVVPKAGTALLFYHPVMHRGDAVVSGRKYVMRTDVMYSVEQ